MLSSELEFCLNEAFQRARDQRHEFMTVEHLLLALLDIPRVNEILKACNSNITELRRQLTEFIEEQTPLLAQDDDTDVQPTLGFQRVLQRAVFHVQSSGKKEVTGSNVLVAIFSEKQSQAVYFLNLQDITRLDVVNYISHGMPQLPGEGNSEEQEASLETETEAEATPLERYATNLNQLAIDGKIDPLIGREIEIERTVQILCRRTKNNPVLIGEPGVGKTAIVEGLAQICAADLEDFADEGVAVGMGAAACQPQQNVARIDSAAIDNFGFFHDSHAKACQIIVLPGVHARHFCGFAADERAARHFATPPDTFDDRGGTSWGAIRVLYGGMDPTEREEIDAEAFRDERIALQLRTAAGLPKAFLTEEMMGEKVPVLAAEGLLVEAEGRVILTDRGKLVADSVAAYLV